MDDARKSGHEWLCIDQSCRKKYDAMLQHGVAGFSTDETRILDEAVERLRVKQSMSEDAESICTEQDCRAESNDQDKCGAGSDSESELNGFLEHQEESIAPAASDNQFEFSGLSEDLDMASRLGGDALH